MDFFLPRLEKNEPTMEIFDELLDASLFSMAHLKGNDLYDSMMNFYLNYQFPNQWSKDKSKQLTLRSKNFTIVELTAI